MVDVGIVASPHMQPNALCHQCRSQPLLLTLTHSDEPRDFRKRLNISLENSLA